MGLPPARPIQEPPDRELAGFRIELIEVAARDVDGEDSARLLLHRLDVKAVARVGGEGSDDPVKKEGPADQDVQPAPVPDESWVPSEVDPGRQLMAESQRDRQVGIEMDEVPGFIREAASCDRDRHHDDGDHESKGDDGRQKALVAGYEVAQLAGNVLAVAELLSLIHISEP